MLYIYGNIYPIKINPSHVSKQIPAPWIRHEYQLGLLLRIPGMILQVAAVLNGLANWIHKNL